MARLATLALAFLIILASSMSCGGDDRPDVADDQATLRISLRFEPGILDPQRTSQAQDLGIIRQLYRGLFWYDPNLKLIPMAAKELPSRANGGITEDGLLYTIKLKEGLKWSDGKELTAADFEYAAKRLFDPRTNAPRAAAYYDIKGGERFNTCKTCSEADLAKLRDEVGVDSKDDHTLVISLNAPRASLTSLMVDPAFYAIREDLISAYGDKWTETQNIVSSGPFILKERVANERLVLVPNKNWWGPPSKVGSVTFVFISDPLKAFNAYLSGELDVVEVPPEQKSTVDNDPDLVKQNRQFLLLQTQVFFLSNHIPPFDNMQVRQAFALAVDRNAFVSGPLQGVGKPAYSFLPPGVPGHDKQRGMEWKVDTAKARATLAAAGYPDGSGLPPIVFGYVPGGTTQPFGEFLRTQLKENLGVRLELQEMTVGAWRTAFDKREHMILGTGWQFPPEAGPSLSEIFGCQRSEGTKCAQFPGNNVAQYVNLEADRKLQQASKEPNLRRRAALYADAEEVIVKDSPAIFMANLGRNILVSSRVHGLITTPLDSLFPGQHHLERAYIARD